MIGAASGLSHYKGISMRDTFLAAVRELVYYTRSTDNSGFLHYIPMTLIENLEIEYKEYCRKHGIRTRAKSSKMKVDGSGTAPTAN